MHRDHDAAADSRGRTARAGNAIKTAKAAKDKAAKDKAANEKAAKAKSPKAKPAKKAAKKS